MMAGLQWVAPHPLVWAAIIALLAILILTLRKAWSRLYDKSRIRLAWVSLLNIIAVACVVLMLAPPIHESEDTAEIVLLTEGADLESLSSSDDIVVAPGGPDPGQVADDFISQVDQLVLRRPEVGAVSVLGHGLDAEQWSRLSENLQVNFDPPALSGPVDLHWPQALDTGEVFSVSGKWLSGGADVVAEARLLDPAGQTVDVTSVRNTGRFFLQTMPVAAGNSEFMLEVENGGETVQIPLAVFVRRSAPLSVLIIQSSPSFETRQLTNWAADRGSEVLVLSQISRERFITQSFNRPDNADVRLSPETFANSDLLVMDGRGFMSLEDSQRSWLVEAVREGLGLFILADDSLAEGLENNPPSLLDGFLLIRNPDQPDDTLVQVPGVTTYTLLGLPGYELEAPGGSPLFRDDAGRLLSIYRNVGLGRVAVSIARERHRWFTNGEIDVYSAYWGNLMARLARTRSAPYFEAPEAGYPVMVEQRQWICAAGRDMELSFSIQGPLLDPDEGVESMALKPAPDTRGSQRQCAAWWPAVSGWHQLTLENSESEVLDQLNVRVNATEELSSSHQYRRQLATTARAAMGSQAQGNESTLTRMPLQPFWPLLIFLLSASILWLERRI